MNATGLADLIARREVSVSELLDAAIETIERLNPALNAIIATFYDRARSPWTWRTTLTSSIGAGSFLKVARRRCAKTQGFCTSSRPECADARFSLRSCGRKLASESSGRSWP